MCDKTSFACYLARFLTFILGGFLIGLFADFERGLSEDES